MAWHAWERRRRARLHSIRAMVAAPLDAEILGNENVQGSHDTHHKELQKVLTEMFPEMEEIDAERLAAAKKVLEEYKDSPIRLDLQRDAAGRLSVSMDRPK